MFRRAAAVLASLSLLVVACGSEDAKSPSGSGGTTGGGSSTATAARALVSSPSDGIATFYDADGSGNCGFDATPKDLDVVALDMAHYDGSASCGACLHVTGPKGELTVRVVDSCPGCASTGANLDLSAEAFAKIAAPSDGRVAITYQLVTCNVSGNLGYHFKDGSSKYWTAIQIRNSRLPVAKVEYQNAAGSFVEMPRVDYNYFVAEKGVGDVKPLTLRVSSSDGQTVVDTVTGGIPSDKTVSGSKQFQ